MSIYSDQEVSKAVTTFNHSTTKLLNTYQLETPFKPKVLLKFPSILSDLTAITLSDQLTHWSAVIGYADYKVSLLKGTLILAELKVEQEFALQFVSRVEKTVTEKKLCVAALDIILKLQKIVATLKADIIVIDALKSGYDKKYQAVSRELTRRSNELYKG